MNNQIEEVYQLTKRLFLIAEGITLAEKNSRPDSMLPLHLRAEEEAVRDYYKSEFTKIMSRLKKLFNLNGGRYASC